MNELYVPNQPITVGLRFKTTDAKKLDHAAEEALRFGNTEQYTLFKQAAQAATTGDPMMVQCDAIEEAYELAAAIVNNAAATAPAFEASPE